MQPNSILAKLTGAVVLASVTLAPISALAQSKLDSESHHRQQTKNLWRNITVGSGALGLYGLLKHDNTLFFAGAAGALYSASRYEHDRRSQSRVDQARANYFGRSSYTYNGHRYHRRTVLRNGKKYYQFVRN